MRADPAAPALIALDWGTTSLRAYLIAESGEVLDRRSAPWGILHVPDGDFSAAFRAVTADWRTMFGALPAVASGMIGSAQGWVEAPYADVPADAAALSRSLVHLAEAGLWIVPGLAQRGRSPDVMRGEETQLFGAMERERSLGGSATVVLPGTHSKWVRVEGGRIGSFTTYMTGELFAVLRSHSILGRLAAPGAGAELAGGEGFERGVRAARDAPSGLASVLFSTRAAVLVGGLAPDHVLDYLSGLLIGDEVRAGLAAGGPPAALIGEEALCRRYAAALARFGVEDVRLLGDTAPAGLWRIAREVLDPQRGG